MVESNQNTNNEYDEYGGYDEYIKLQNIGNPELWESLGIDPIKVDPHDPDYIEKVTEKLGEAIEQVTERLKDET